MSSLVLAALLQVTPASAGDPHLFGTSWGIEPDQERVELGTGVAAGGDVNGDGYDDLFVGAPWGADPSPWGDSLNVFHGSASGPGTVPDWTYDLDGNAQATFVGDLNGDGFGDLSAMSTYGANDLLVFFGSPTGLGAAPGWSARAPLPIGSEFGADLASACDVNGDGYDDLVTTARNRGEVYVWHGGPAGLPAAESLLLVGAPGFGADLACARDVDGDGYDDLVVMDGSVGRLFRGSAAGLATVAAWTSPAGALDGAGDLDGDGYADLLLVASRGGRNVIDVYPGGPAGVGPLSETIETTAASLPSVAFGDVNADGFDDLWVGLGDAYPYSGAAALYLGSAAGVATTPWFTLDTDRESAWLGGAVGMGDLNGDGFDDPVTGAYRWSNGEQREGAAFASFGPFPDTDGDGTVDAVDPCPLDPAAQLDSDGDGIGNGCDQPTLRVVGTVGSGAPVSLRATGAVPGEVVHFAGVIGGGGAGPCPAALGGECLALGPGAVLLGSSVANAQGTAAIQAVVPATPQPEGYTLQAAIVRGVGGADSVTSPVTRIDGAELDADADGSSDADEALHGTDPTLPDTDGDGLTDSEEHTSFLDPLLADSDGDGARDDVDLCLAGDDAADPDGDGVPDRCDNCPSVANPLQGDGDSDGRGTACEGTVVSTPRWSPNLLAATGSRSVAGAGDVDGDGFDDLLVGGPTYAGGSGVLTLFDGSASGLGRNASWTVAPPVVDAAYGSSVAAAGDVDGDGFGDVLVGASGTSRASLFLGGPGGPSGLPVWIVQTGWVVASAGDVDGDGYDDVAVGQPLEWGGEVRVYHGSPAGLSLTPAWTWISDTERGLGETVGSAGDVNGDGYDDLLLAAAPTGAAYVFLGSPSGLSDEAAWRVSDPSVGFAHAAAGAGDVNGDGYDDVLVSSRGYAQQEYVFVVVEPAETRLYLGSPHGPSTTPDWIGAMRVGRGWGMSAVGAAAGDLDGDSFDDVVVGCTDDPEGPCEVSVHLSSATGLGAEPAWTLSSAAGAVGAGDVDGDGLDDLVTFEGTAMDEHLGRAR